MLASRQPVAVLALPAFNGGHRLSAVLSDLRAQTEPAFRLLIVDDCSSDETPELSLAAAAEDDRISYHRNPQRLGLTENWRQAYRLARELAPEARYFGWVSDHDRWEMRWLAVLSRHLEAHPEAVLAYPLVRRFTSADGTVAPPWRFDTHGQREPGRRFRVAAARMVAGDMVYGLFRAPALERAGVFRPVLLPDRLLLAELSIVGEFHQVNELLWHRRFEVMSTFARQRVASLKDRPYRCLPWPVMHLGALTWSLVIQGAGMPLVGRTRGLVLVARYAAIAHRLWLEQHLVALLRRRPGGVKSRAPRL